MDSLRQLSMKFLEREELANYNFQNEFLKPFVVVMQRSNSAEIRELIVRCVSQMVLSRVNNVKSGWKSVFMVFTAAAADERKNIVLLAFQTMEKIVREYFSYITETETMTFTDCVKCLITFTNSRFDSDVSLNAIAFLRFCAVKLADGGLVCDDERKEDASSKPVRDNNDSVGLIFTEKDDHAFFWLPLLSGLSKLTSDPRSAIRKSALEVLFNILKDHGNLFPRVFWISLFSAVIFPIFSSIYDKQKTDLKDDESSLSSRSSQLDGNTWDMETSALAAEFLVELFVSFFNVVRSELRSVVAILAAFIVSPVQGPASTGVAALRRLVRDIRGRLMEEEWRDVFFALKEAASSSFPGFLKLLGSMDSIKVPDLAPDYADMETSSSLGLTNDDSEDDYLQATAYIVSRMKSHITAQLLIIQVASDLHKMHSQPLSAATTMILIEIFSSVATHAHELNSNRVLQIKLQKVCSILEVADPPMVHFENESYQNYLNFLSDLLTYNPSLYEVKHIEEQLVSLCEKILQIYLVCAGESVQSKQMNAPVCRWSLPLGSAAKEELAARTPLVLSVFRIIHGLEQDCFRRYIPQLFPILVDFVRSEHSSGEVQRVLSSIFESCIGPLIIKW